VDKGSAVTEPPIVQVALCVDDVSEAVRLYVEALGFADAGGKAIWGERVARLQGLGDDVSFVFWWLVGRQDFVQLELFRHTIPPQRPLPADWRPCDLGWVRFGIAVPDFADAVERLRIRGVETITEPIEIDGLRRVCFRDPHARIVVELMEEGTATPGGIRPRFYDLAPALVYVALSVGDLDAARRFFCETLGLVEEPEVVLHPPESETLWGLHGAQRESFVARGGDIYLEIVRYDDPVGRPKPADYRLSDQGFLNIALGYRQVPDVAAAHGRVVGSGYHANAPAPTSAGASYVLDDQGTSVELFHVPRELDPELGFTPRPSHRRPLFWPRPTVPAARPETPAAEPSRPPPARRNH
jgi:catechol 2,3-dioxygenase-like lactoylglutathione lyase family enzyme